MSEVTLDTEAAKADGVSLEEPVYSNYWGFEETHRHMLPDGKQYLVIQRMNEGAKARYQRAIRSDVTVSRSTGDAKLQSDPAKERHALLEACVVDWYMLRPDKDGKWAEMSFKRSGAQNPGFAGWLEVADPRLIEDLEKACRKLNPWLLQDMTVEDIDQQIAELEEMREEVIKQEQGE